MRRRSGTLVIDFRSGGRPEDYEGEYQCFARNKFGTALSNRIRLQVSSECVGQAQDAPLLGGWRAGCGGSFQKGRPPLACSYPGDLRAWPLGRGAPPPTQKDPLERKFPNHCGTASLTPPGTGQGRRALKDVCSFGLRKGLSCLRRPPLTWTQTLSLSWAFFVLPFLFSLPSLLPPSNPAPCPSPAITLIECSFVSPQNPPCGPRTT